jgi:hypothetical protein
LDPKPKKSSAIARNLRFLDSGTAILPARTTACSAMDLTYLVR